MSFKIALCPNCSASFPIASAWTYVRCYGCLRVLEVVKEEA